MPLRLLQVSLPTGTDRKVDELFSDLEIVATWNDPTPETSRVIQVLVPAEDAEPVMDKLEQWYGGRTGFRVVLYTVAATVPRIKSQKGDEGAGEDESYRNGKKSTGRVSREELYTAASESLGINRVFLAMTFLSSIVAALGLVGDDVAVIIGAMVIAPLLGPNVAMALAVTLGDLKLLRSSLITNLAGVALGLVVAVAIGATLSHRLDTPSIASRTHVDIEDLVLALAAGAAGAFAMSRGQSGALIGVMVAVALMPPLVVFGMLVGAGDMTRALGALLLLLSNVVCVNLAGVATFVIQGVWPRTWWEGERAKRATARAIAIWVVLLAVLVLLLFSAPWKINVPTSG